MAAGWPAKANYATGDVLTATQMNDIGGTLNLINPYTAGKNAIINGAFNVWQRGTSFSNPAVGAYTADRYICYYDGTGATRTISQQAFTAGSAPVAGYESQYFFRYAQTVVGTQTYTVVGNRIEDVRTYAGQTVTVSFWAKSATAAGIPGVALVQNFGTAGSASVTTYAATAPVLTTSWARYTTSIAVPAITGKTLGASSYLELQLSMAVAVVTVDIWGVQVEQGSTATPFQTASGTIGGELALCQRYYWRTGGDYTYNVYGTGINGSATGASGVVNLPVTLRVPPLSVDYNLVAVQENVVGGVIAVTTIVLSVSTKNIGSLTLTVASGLTQYRPVIILANNSTSSYLGFSAEL
jgi:hypothetical protein